jgi:GTP-binding protein LepA
MAEQEIKNIRNFSIIAHIDHGKSTLADRMLEITKTVEKRKMKEQVLDSMDLERERGITIKMQPVRMNYVIGSTNYVLNLIDTPGHIDFAYEVSRALKAVEGTILLVDATQGVQAQTLSVLSIAREQNLAIIPVVSKIDSPLARTEEVKSEVAKLLDIDENEVLGVSGKTGGGVKELLDRVVEIIPAPKVMESDKLEALIFDFEYSHHRGVVVYARIFSGKVKKTDGLLFIAANEKFQAGEVGIFAPEKKPVEGLSSGEIGYIVTGIKQPGIASVGDTVTHQANPSPAHSGYQNPQPVVWASIFPESQDNFDELRQSLERLRLSDSSLSFEEEASSILGRGFRCGFLGMLHLEIVIERLRREYGLELVVTTPSISYEVTVKGGKTDTYYSPSLFPEHGQIEKVREPWVEATIITPAKYVGDVMTLLYNHEAEVGHTEVFYDGRNAISVAMPLRELMRGFFDSLKSVSSGFASLSYIMTDMRDANVARLDILVAEEEVPAFARIISRARLDEESRKIVDKLHELLPKQLFVTKIQARALGRIIASKTLSAMRKDVTGYLYGGDVTRKKKLLEKQKKGKKKMKERGKVNIPQEAFIKMIRGGD